MLPLMFDLEFLLHDIIFQSGLKHLTSPNSIFVRPTSPNEVLKMIHSFKSNKASGPNSIPLRLLNTVS